MVLRNWIKKYVHKERNEDYDKRNEKRRILTWYKACACRNIFLHSYLSGLDLFRIPMSFSSSNTGSGGFGITLHHEARNANDHHGTINEDDIKNNKP